MTTDPIQVAKDELLAWLQSRKAMRALSGDGWLPMPLAAEYIGVTMNVMRRMREEGSEPDRPSLRFRSVGGSKRHRWQVNAASLLAYTASGEER